MLTGGEKNPGGMPGQNTLAIAQTLTGNRADRRRFLAFPQQPSNWKFDNSGKPTDNKPVGDKWVQPTEGDWTFDGASRRRSAEVTSGASSASPQVAVVGFLGLLAGFMW